MNTSMCVQKRVLVYNGDVDMACNFLGDEWFVDRLIRPVSHFYKASLHCPHEDIDGKYWKVSVDK